MERRLAAILAANVVGYLRLIRHDEEGTIAPYFKPTEPRTSMNLIREDRECLSPGTREYGYAD